MVDKNNCCNKNIEEISKSDCCVGEIGETIQRLVRVIQLFERDQIKIYGVTTSQCNTLLEIYKAGSLTMNELSDKMNLNTSTMTRVLDNLVRDKYISRDRSETDRRIVVVSLTETGYEMAQKLSDSVNQYYKKIIENIPEGQVDTVLDSINTLQKAFEKANPNCC
jgi:MarR family transcriptional regulator, organic hydroperoxide resistance regulator